MRPYTYVNGEGDYSRWQIDFIELLTNYATFLYIEHGTKWIWNNSNHKKNVKIRSIHSKNRYIQFYYAILSLIQPSLVLRCVFVNLGQT